MLNHKGQRQPFGEEQSVRKITVIAVLGVVLVFGLAMQAAAYTSIITEANADLAGYGFTGPYAQVDISLTDATHADVTFTGLTSTFGGNPVIYLMGDGGTAALQVNASTFTVSGLTGTNSGTGFSPGGFTVLISPVPPVDGFGKFNLVIDDDDGYTHAVDTLAFTLTNTSGTWASDADVLALNAAGYDAAAHIFPASNPASATNDVYTSMTGFAAEVPIPAALPLFGTGLLGLLGLGWRRKARA
jgi:hypothetical protein